MMLEKEWQHKWFSHSFVFFYILRLQQITAFLSHNGNPELPNELMVICSDCDKVSQVMASILCAWTRLNSNFHVDFSNLRGKPFERCPFIQCVHEPNWSISFHLVGWRECVYAYPKIISWHCGIDNKMEHKSLSLLHFMLRLLYAKVFCIKFHRSLHAIHVKKEHTHTHTHTPNIFGISRLNEYFSTAFIAWEFSFVQLWNQLKSNGDDQFRLQ